MSEEQSSEQQQAKLKVNELNLQLRQETQNLQQELMQRLQVKDYVQNCIQQKCGDLQQRSKQIQEEQKERKNQLQKTKKPYELDVDKYMNNRAVSLDTVLTMEKANLCQQECQKPMEIIKKVLTQNFGDVQQNIQTCTSDCQSLNPETNQSTVDYLCVQTCLEKNIDILKQMDKKVNDDFLQRKDEIFY